MTFKYDGLGFYRQRDGGKAEVVAESRGLLLGFSSNNCFTSWETNGQWVNGVSKHRFNLIAKWSEPAEPRTLVIEIWQNPDGSLWPRIPNSGGSLISNLERLGAKVIDTLTWTEGQSSEIERLLGRMEDISVDLDAAIEVAFECGAIEWVRRSHPKAYERLCELHPEPSCDDEGWIKWEGGECPVDPFTVVDVKFRDVGTDFGDAAEFSWKGRGWKSSFDIIAYRLHKP